jgi:hypothetical protein
MVPSCCGAHQHCPQHQPGVSCPLATRILRPAGFDRYLSFTPVYRRGNPRLGTHDKRDMRMLSGVTNRRRFERAKQKCPSPTRTCREVAGVLPSHSDKEMLDVP